MKKLFTMSVLFMSIFMSNRLSAQNIYETVKYKGKLGTNEIVLNMKYMGNVLLGDYYYTKYNKVINFMSEKDYVDENKNVILKEYIDNGFSNHDEVVKAMIKSPGYFMFFLKDLDNYEKQNTLNGTWISTDGKKSYDVILTKTSK